MVLVIKRNTKLRDLKKLAVKLKSKKGLKASEYCGKVKIKEDAVLLQRKLRDEWK